MSIEQYKELALQEQYDPKNKITSFCRQLTALLTFWKNTPLETLLLEDDETFKSELTKKYGQTETFEGIGEVNSVIIPHHLSSLLNNSSMSPKIEEKIVDEIEQTPLILFIHGLGGNLQQFDEQIKVFAEYSDVVALDLPGSGLSKQDKNFSLTLDSFTSFIQLFLDKKGFANRKLLIIGHSYGTQVALRLMGELSNIVGIVMIAPPKFLFKRSWFQNAILKVLLTFPPIFQCFRKLDRLNNIESISLKRLFGDLNEVSDYYKFKQFKYNLSTNSHNILTQALSWIPMTAEDVIPNHRKFITPSDDSHSGQLLIIDGSLDKVTHQGGQSYRDLLGSYNVTYDELPGVGHNLMMERYQELNDMLLQFAGICDFRLKSGHSDDFRNRLATA